MTSPQQANKRLVEESHHRCSLCPFTTPWPHNMERHVADKHAAAAAGQQARAAEAAQPLRCSFCWHSTPAAAAAEMRRHLGAHLRNQNYVCTAAESCGFSSERAAPLLPHLERHAEQVNKISPFRQNWADRATLQL